MQYSPGDLVFVRQGKGNPFELKAKIIKSLQNNSYLLQTDTGLMRKYNQCDLTLIFMTETGEHIPYVCSILLHTSKNGK